ncbi:hypothetical protein NC651_035164 [Populus alba x Populus x berolinensis]|nr:hypothetical protein NC651_035164 [Populus alba x Populus x berolinensis]
MHIPWGISPFSTKKKTFCLADEILVEILSWLPAKFLLRCRCVCKHWNALIQDPYLLEMHMIRAKRKCYDVEHVVETPISINESRREIFKYVTNCRGLILERSANDTKRYRVRNPETRQFLDVPHPISHEKNISRILLTFVPSTDEYKLVAAYYNKKRVEVEGCEILTLGRDDCSWRSLEVPVKSSKNEKRCSKVVVGNVFGEVDFVLFEAKDCEVVTLDLESESFISNTVPHGYFSNMEKIWIFSYSGKLALVDIVEGKLSILVLVDHIKHRWVERRVALRPGIFPSAEDEHVKVNFSPVSANRDFLCFEKYGEKFIYDVRCKKITESVETVPERKVALLPNMITLKGMQPENYEPREKRIEELNPGIQQGSMKNNSNCSVRFIRSTIVLLVFSVFVLCFFSPSCMIHK